jgi:hypothetical protein
MDDLKVDLDQKSLTQIVHDDAAQEVRHWKIWEWSDRGF